MAEISCLQVDAFTDRPFAGNPAAVCLLEEERDEQWMQAVAAEMNLSETAFVYPRTAGFDLRWFTPAVEVELCGHATLASAHVLWSEEVVGRDEPIVFHTKSGVLTCSRQSDRIELDFPAASVDPAESTVELAAALGVRPSFVGRSGFDQLVLVEFAQRLSRLTNESQRRRQ